MAGSHWKTLLTAALVALAGCRTTQSKDTSSAKDVGFVPSQSCKALHYMHTSAENILRAADAANHEKGCHLQMPPIPGITDPAPGPGPGEAAPGTTPAPSTAVGGTTPATSVATTSPAGLLLDDAPPAPDAANSCTTLRDLVTRWNTYMTAIKTTYDQKNCAPAGEANEGPVHIFDHPTCGAADFNGGAAILPTLSTCSDNYNAAHHTVCYTCQPGSFAQTPAISAITCQTEIESRAAIDIWCSENDCGGQPTTCRVAGAATPQGSVVSDDTTIDSTTLTGDITTKVSVKGEAGVFGNKVALEGDVSVTLRVSAKARITNSDQSQPMTVVRDGVTQYGGATTYACWFSTVGNEAVAGSASTEVGFKIPLTDTGATAGFSVTATGTIEREIDQWSGAHPAGGKTREAVLLDCLNRGKAEAVTALANAKDSIVAFVRHQASSSDWISLSSGYPNCRFENGSRYGVKALKWQLVPRQGPDYPDLIKLQIKTDNWFGATESPIGDLEGIRIFSGSGFVEGEGRVAFTDIWNALAAATPDSPPANDFIVSVLNNNPFLPVNHKWYYEDCQ